MVDFELPYSFLHYYLPFFYSIYRLLGYEVMEDVKIWAVANRMSCIALHVWGESLSILHHGLRD